jgi:hypothetical protein
MAKNFDRDALCRELLGIEKKHAKDLARIAEIKAALKEEADKNYQIRIDGLGIVRVSAPKPERTEGEAHALVVDKFLALPCRRRETLIEQGLVVTAPIIKKAYYGSVSVELF